MNYQKSFQIWRKQLLNISKNRSWILVIGSIIAVYFISLIVISRTVYTQLTPSKQVKMISAFFPLPAARTGLNFIWMSNYYERYAYIDSFVRKTDLTNFTPQETRDQVVDYLVEANLISKLAKQKKIRVSNREIESAYTEIGNQPDVGGTGEVERVLRELYGMTPNSFKRLIGEQLLRERVEQQVFLHIKTRHILVGTESEAKKLADDIKNGSDFSELAKKFSQDAKSRDQGGTLGSIGRGSGLPKELEDGIFSLPPESLPAIIKTDLGYHVVDTEEIIGEIDQNFSDWLNNKKQERRIKVYLPTTLEWAHRDKK